jgi:hypothetical protein
VNIVINPLPSGLYRVRIINKHGKVRDVGPLVDEMIVSKHILSFLVRLVLSSSTRPTHNTRVCTHTHTHTLARTRAHTHTTHTHTPHVHFQRWS